MTGSSTALPTAGLVLPDYGGLCLDAVLPAAVEAVGATSDALPTGARERLGVPTAERVCVVLVDGLGHRALVERAGHAPFLRRRLGETQVLTAGFPSTTAASMGLFGTGRGPGRTGLAGYTVRNPSTGGLANLVSWEGAGDPRTWQREPSLLGLAAASGTAVRSVGPARFAGSGLTEAALGGAQYVAAESLADRVDTTVRALGRPGLVYLYWGEVDKVGHHHGWRSAEWGDALSELDAELARLVRSVPRGTLVLVTADHGGVDLDHDSLVDVAHTPVLREDVELVAGEPRAAHVHAAAGRVDAVLARWRDHLADRAVVASRDEAVAAGWFGEVAPHVLPLIGDVVVASTGRGGVADSRTQTPQSLLLKGVHGSLTPEEMLVPLVVVA
ncbi:alkaline phosphatase family protein [Cellulomonas carbonis]|uniref:Phosphodiesterase n=1 Tax=Cellulomonas carbonis T26 TaxID=947969 RepID=A0A0A0BY04_9CELL|nr:nucleotide pyrophosphatase/phosphodiesterase family protein [Cellulomonas carbonis]KGM12582.1 phosphodiesterase [Cellulomonas carbonis T26]GGB93269.1 nucleotide pyrophosphatase [Cellulomonas carbonis]